MNEQTDKQTDADRQTAVKTEPRQNERRQQRSTNSSAKFRTVFERMYATTQKRNTSRFGVFKNVET